MVTAESAAQAVQNGAKLLDGKQPGWREIICLDILDIDVSEVCIIGQAFGNNDFFGILEELSGNDFFGILEELSGEASPMHFAVNHGFIASVGWCEWDSSDLYREWKAFLSS